MALECGLPKVVEIAKEYTDKPIIYDHLKAGTDIPEVGKKFVGIVKDAEIDAVMIFHSLDQKQRRYGLKQRKKWI